MLCLWQFALYTAELTDAKLMVAMERIIVAWSIMSESCFVFLKPWYKPPNADILIKGQSTDMVTVFEYLAMVLDPYFKKVVLKSGKKPLSTT